MVGLATGAPRAEHAVHLLLRVVQPWLERLREVLQYRDTAGPLRGKPHQPPVPDERAHRRLGALVGVPVILGLASALPGSRARGVTT